VARIREGATYVVKLHGDAAHPDDIVLSRDDYHEFFERRPAMALLLEGLLLNRTFFFVGYGLRDPNFRQLFSRIARMLRQAQRPAFATSFEMFRRVRALPEQAVGAPAIAPRAHYRAPPSLSKSWSCCASSIVSPNSDAPAVATSPPPDVPPPTSLHRLRDLLQQVGGEILGLCNQPTGDVHQLAEVLTFLTAHGWRPPKAPHQRAVRPVGSAGPTVHGHR